MAGVGAVGPARSAVADEAMLRGRLADAEAGDSQGDAQGDSHSNGVAVRGCCRD